LSSPNKRKLIVIGLAALLVCAAGSIGLIAFEHKARHASLSDRRVVLVIVDALRADAVGSYGYPRHTTPAIDAIAREGVLFERFYAASSWTLPSVASILTGVSPSAHGAGYPVFAPWKTGTKVRADIPLLAEKLPGIYSAAIVNNTFLMPIYGFQRGFALYDARRSGFTWNRSATTTTNAAIGLLKAHEEGGLFLLVHYFDPHSPYTPPAELAARFAQGAQGTMDLRSKARFREMYEGRYVPPEPERLYLRGMYDGEVAYADQQIGRLVDWMRRRGMLDDTWLVITADHGEEHFDHGSFEHGHRFEDEVARVPLVVRAPGGAWHAGERIAASARQVDLLPTVLEIFGRKPDPSLEGESLLPFVGDAKRRDRPCYMEFHKRGAQQRALFDGRYKIIAPVDGGEGYFYDLKADPGERTRLDSKDPRYAGLMSAMERYRKERIRAAKEMGEVPSMSPTMLNSLQSLGYVR
jgi:choline-sulfatase